MLYLPVPGELVSNHRHRVARDAHSIRMRVARRARKVRRDRA